MQEGHRCCSRSSVVLSVDLSLARLFSLYYVESGHAFFELLLAELLAYGQTQLDFSNVYHPYTGDQTEVVNRSSKNLLRCLVGDNIWTWDTQLSQAVFAYN